MVPAQEVRPALTAVGPHLASESGTPADIGMAPEGPDPLLMACDQEVVQTIMDLRAPSTKALYANRWKIFAEWCRAHKEVPERSSVPMILHFLQPLLERKLSASTLRVGEGGSISAKFTFLLAMASAKHVSELHALSMSATCTC